MRDQTVKLNDMEVRSLVVRNTESLSDVEINEIKQSKYRIICGHPEVFLGKLRKLLDCEEVRRHMRAIVIDEAHLIVEWQVFNSCLLFLSSYFGIIYCKDLLTVYLHFILAPPSILW